MRACLRRFAWAVVPCGLASVGGLFGTRVGSSMMRPTAIKGSNAVAYYDALVTDPRVAQKPSRVEDYYFRRMSSRACGGGRPPRSLAWWGRRAGRIFTR